MILASHVLATTAEPESLWACWSRVSEWPTWDPSLVWVKFGGPFARGERGMMKRKGELLRPFKILDVVDGRRFAFHEHWVFADLVCSFEIKPDPLGTRMACLARLTGPLAWFYWMFLRGRWSAQLPVAARGLARLAAKG